MMTQRKNTPGAYPILAGMLSALALTYNIATAQNIMLDGTVTGTPQGNHPTTQVNAYLKNTAYPNPYTNQVNITQNTNTNHETKINVYDGAGKQIYTRDIQLKQGENQITIEGLRSPGIKIITIGQNTYKTIQTNQTQHSPKINITHNFLIKPYTINEDDINQLTLDFTWANGETTQHNVQTDGHIHVYREEYTNITQTALVTHNTDTATYSLWQFFRTKNQSLADTNYAQFTTPHSLDHEFTFLN